MKNSQTIEQFMTYAPHTINSEMPLTSALQMMKKFDVRHLPVQSAGKLVGVISERDLKLGTSLDKYKTLLVEDVMKPEPYSVSQYSPLGEVIERMATNRYGCAVVCNQKGQTIGIFTAIDGLRALADWLNGKARKTEFAKGNIA